MEQEQIYNWLSSAFNNGPERFSEFFYYDRTDHQFFSILLIDYFMFDKNFNVPKDTNVSYSAENIYILANRMKRIDQNDPTILAIPLKHSEIPLQEQIDRFLNLNAINIDTVTIWLPEDTSIVISLDQQESANTTENKISISGTKPWWKFW